MRKVLLAAVSAVLAGCQAMPHRDAVPAEPMAAGERALRDQDLVGALLAYERVPGTDPRYLEAQAAAVEIERRLVAGCEGLLAGLRGRHTGDAGAAHGLRAARSAFPTLPGLAALAEGNAPHAGAAASATAEVVAVPPVRVEPCELADPRWDDLPIRAPRAASESFAAAIQPPVRDPSAENLAAVEKKLQDGAADAAVADLLDLAQRAPDELRVRVRLARLLHQRALLAYGRGDVVAAIGDWERVLEFDPGNVQAKDLLSSARRELTAAPGR